jgi:tetratricopeptide (TPR) repeat protein
MNQAAKLALLAAVSVCSLAAAGQRSKHRAPPSVPSAPAGPTPHTESIRDNNLGIALMERQQFQEALGKFQTACIMNPASDISCLNIGIALLNMSQYDAARNILTKSAARDAADPRVWFNLGLLARIEGQPDDARADFEKVAALDPQDPDTQYEIGLLDSEAGRDDPAVDAFENAVKLDRFHASAELALAQAKERQADTDSALVHLDRFRRLVASDRGRQISSVYGAQGKYSLAEELPPEPVAVDPALSVHFIDVTALSGLPAGSEPPRNSRRQQRSGRRAFAATGSNAAASAASPSKSLASFLGSGACVIDYDGDGKPDLFLVNADGNGDAALFHNVGRGKFVNVTKLAGITFRGEGTGCAVGDYDNDGRPDIALSSNGGVLLCRNVGDGKFEDVTERSGIRTDGLSLGLTFIDYDGDGLLDLYLTRFNDFQLDNPARPFSFALGAVPPGNVLWRNKGDGTFENKTAAVALAGNSPSVAALGSDVNNDRASDIVLTGWEKSPTIYLNQLDGAFQPTNPWTSAMPGHTAGAVSFDFDGDSRMDLVFTHWAPPGLSLWRNLQGTSFERVALPDIGWMRGWGVSALDYDNDGHPDIVAVGENFAGEGRIVLFRNEGDQGFRDVTGDTGLDKVVLHNPRAILAFDYDGDGATDLLITQNDLPPVLLKNTGARKNGWMQLALSGTRDNRSGIGTEVTLFSGPQRQKWEVTGASGYLGQNSTVIQAGLGNANGADVVHLQWPKGSLQNELLIRGGSRIPVTEIDRRDNATKP